MSTASPAAGRTRQRILSGARGLLAAGASPTVDQLARAAGVSRASFYRVFQSREELLRALDVPPEPQASERILAAALDEVGARGLAALSMDDLADRAGVSRATLYRLFPGKAAVFSALVYRYSPLQPVIAMIGAAGEQPPDVLMPKIARTVFRFVCAEGADRTGLLRAFFYEVTRLAPDTEDAAREAVGGVVGALALYIANQMAEGRLRQMHPFLALQAFVGPIFFHLMTRRAAERVLGVALDGEKAVTELAETWVRAMRPEEAKR